MNNAEANKARKRHSEKSPIAVNAYIEAVQGWGSAWDRLGASFQEAEVTKAVADAICGINPSMVKMSFADIQTVFRDVKAICEEELA